MDLWPIIVQQGFRNTPDDNSAVEKLMSWLMAHSSPGMVAFAFKNRAKLPGIVDAVWKWHTVDEFLATKAKPRWERFLAAAQSACGRGGHWRARAEQSLDMNMVDKRDFCQQVLLELKDGRGEHVRVMVLMGRHGGEGKSFVLSPLLNLFGEENVQATPQKGNFPLLGLESKKVALLDDWCFDEGILPLPTQLLWYEGKPFPLNRPQNSGAYEGHLLYQGTAPIFVTAKEKDLGFVIQQATVDFALGKASGLTMLLRRLRVYHFTVPLPVRPLGAPKIHACPRCFAEMMLQHGQA